MSPDEIFRGQSHVYVVAYGSLMFADGINGRGMRHVYRDDELTLVRIRNYSRGMTCRWGKTHYYGIRPVEGGDLVAVVFKVHNAKDLRMLNLSEGCDSDGNSRHEDGGYMCTTVNPSDISVQLDAPAYVYQLNQYPQHGKSTANPRYTDYVDKGISELWGPIVLDDFHSNLEATSAPIS